MTPVVGEVVLILFAPVDQPTAVVPYGAVPGTVLDISPFTKVAVVVALQCKVCVQAYG